MAGAIDAIMSIFTIKSLYHKQPEKKRAVYAALS